VSGEGLLIIFPRAFWKAMHNGGSLGMF